MSWIYTYSGRRAGPDADSPSLQDVGIALGRICRFAGNGVRFWPVLLHSFVVADLLPSPLKIHGLTHDGMECVFSDIPTPVKPPEIHAGEARMMPRLREELGVPEPSHTDRVLVKTADEEAFHAEAHTVGPWALRSLYERCPKTEELVMKYAHQYRHDDYLAPDGLAVLDYVKRVQDSIH